MNNRLPAGQRLLSLKAGEYARDGEPYLVKGTYDQLTERDFEHARKVGMVLSHTDYRDDPGVLLAVSIAERTPG